MHWTCACCGEAFDTLPLDIACPMPTACHDLTETEREARCELSSDFCRFDESLYLRACLDVPVHGLDEPFVWGVWLEVDDALWERAQALFDAEPDPDEPAYPARLVNRLYGYRDTLGLPVRLRFREQPLRPLAMLEAGPHELVGDQRSGISAKRVQEIVGPILHRRAG